MPSTHLYVAPLTVPAPRFPSLAAPWSPVSSRMGSQEPQTTTAVTPPYPNVLIRLALPTHSLRCPCRTEPPEIGPRNYLRSLLGRLVAASRHVFPNLSVATVSRLHRGKLPAEERMKGILCGRSSLSLSAPADLHSLSNYYSFFFHFSGLGIIICTGAKLPRCSIYAIVIDIDKANGRSWRGGGRRYLGWRCAERVPGHDEELETMHCFIYMRRPAEAAEELSSAALEGQRRLWDRSSPGCWEQIHVRQQTGPPPCPMSWPRNTSTRADPTMRHFRML